MKLLIAGATGLVGRHVLELALADPRVDAVVAPVRKPLPAHPKLAAPVVDYDHLPEDAPWWPVDAVICALGTTMATAGSRETFRKVDCGYPETVARLAHRHGAETYVLNSAIGADAGSSIFYNKVKGEAEQAVEAVGFRSFTIVRPGVIGGKRDEFRFGERVAVSLLGILAPLLPRRWRVNPAEKIAAAILDAACRPSPGVSHITSAELA